MYMQIQSISIWRQKGVREREREIVCVCVGGWGGGGGRFKNMNLVCTVKHSQYLLNVHEFHNPDTQ